MAHRIAALLVLVLVGLAPALARPAATLAAPTSSTSTGSLGGPLTAPGSTATASSTATVQTTTTSSAGGGGISTGSAVAIAIAAFLIIVGIVVAIFRDARRRAPQRAAASEARIPGSQRPPKARKLSAAERKRRKRGRAPRRR